MKNNHDITIIGYRKLYTKLLRLYPKPFRERFGEGMEQTFNDLCRERKEYGKELFAVTLWAFIDTSAGIIRERTTMSMKKNKRLIIILLAAAFILLIPLVAMQFTDEVVWGPVDFVFAGVLLFGTGLTYELAARKTSNFTYRAAVILALAAAFILVWANAAVGIIGSEDEPANLMYIWVIAVGFIGSIAARFRPLGMARTLFAMALAQVLIVVIALIAGMYKYPGSSVSEIVNVNVFFIALWIGSALLFRQANSINSK